MKYRLIALDIDGTIRPTEQPISDRTRRAISRAGSAGAVVTLATGRMYRSALKSSAELNLTTPIAAFQGAQVSDPTTHRVMWRRPLTSEMAGLALDVLDGWPVEMVAYLGDEVYVPDMTKFAEGYGRRNNVRVHAVGDLRYFASWGFTRLLAVGEEDKIRDLNSELNYLLNGNLYVTRSLPHFCEILNPAGGKEKALSWICDRLGIDHSETIAFGNGYNDVPMLAWAGLGVAVDGAVPEVVEVADRIAPAIEDDGVARVLEELFDNGEIG